MGKGGVTLMLFVARLVVARMHRFLETKYTSSFFFVHVVVSGALIPMLIKVMQFVQKSVAHLVSLVLLIKEMSECNIFSK